MNESNEFSSSGQLKSINSSFSDAYAEIQANALMRGQVVEQYIQNHQNDSPKSMCFNLLSTLFSLFKSEFATNLSLRKALVIQKEMCKKNQQYQSEINEFLSVIRPKFPQMTSFDKVIEELSKTFSNLKNYQTISEAKHQLSDLLEQEKSLNVKKIAIKEQNIKNIKNVENKIAQHQQTIQKARHIEEDLNEKLSHLLEEKQQLEEINFSQIDDLKMKVKEIDMKMDNLSSSMITMKRKNFQKISRIKMKIQSSKTDVKDLQMTRKDLEKELDVVQSKIDFLTNPLSVQKDDTLISPHISRYQLIELQKHLNSLQKVLEDENDSCKKMETQIEELDDFISKNSVKNKEKTAELKTVNKAYENQANFLNQLKFCVKRISELKDELRLVDDVKRSLNLDRIKLTHELDDLSAVWRQRAIDSNSLMKTQNFLAEQNNEFRKVIKKSTMNALDKEMFESTLDAYRQLREELNISIKASPHEISEIVLEQCLN